MNSFKTRLNVVSQEELATTRACTLTSGYDSENTMFVRVKDGYVVPADPALVRKTNRGDREVTCKKTGEKVPPRGTYYDFHHVRGEGHLYREHPGYIMATLKGGCHGWSPAIKLDSNKYVTFNPWRGIKVVFTFLKEWDARRPKWYWEVKVYLMPKFIEGVRVDGNEEILMYEDREVKSIGRWSIFKDRDFEVHTPVFRGLCGLLEKFRTRPEEFSFHYGGYSFNRNLTQVYDLGEVISSKVPLTLRQIFFNFNKTYNFDLLEKEAEVYTRHGVRRLGNVDIVYIKTNEGYFRCKTENPDYSAPVCIQTALGIICISEMTEVSEQDMIPLLEGRVKETREIVQIFRN